MAPLPDGDVDRLVGLVKLLIGWYRLGMATGRWQQPSCYGLLPVRGTDQGGPLKVGAEIATGWMYIHELCRRGNLPYSSGARTGGTLLD